MKIILFEDFQFSNLLPLSYFRPVWELRCGVNRLSDKIQRIFPGHPLNLIARQYLMDYYLEPTSCFNPASVDVSEVLLVNGRLLPGNLLAESLREIPPDSALICENTIVAWRTTKKNLVSYFDQGVLLSDRVFNDFNCQPITADFIHYPWDLLDRCGSEIIKDAQALKLLGKHAGKIDRGSHLLDGENIHLGIGSRIMPGAVLNAENGPIWIGQNTQVMPNAVLTGPLAIGDGCLIKIGAKLYENTSIGPVCKVGGEIEGCIIQEFSNKQHDGFLGHAYLGAWINIGADTNNSDLKNNYGQISIYLNNRSIDTGKRFLGLIMGDHSKTAINTMFNTGTVVGVSCNIYGEGFPPKFVPSFSWGGSGGMREFNFEKALEVAKIVMERRKISFDNNHLKLFEAVKLLSLKMENRVRTQ
jgi:UDP-N-acetylglucosamine diphosphorylase/glucosamine-1-phosphate N-acetyltransferase